MEKAGSLDHRIVKEFEALLRERRARLQEYVRARMTERRTGEPHRSPEDATNAVESLSEDLEVAMLDREIREAAQIDAALERLARDEYGICGNCGTGIGLAPLTRSYELLLLLVFASGWNAATPMLDARTRSRSSA